MSKLSVTRRAALLSVSAAAGVALAGAGAANAQEAPAEVVSSADALRFLYIDAKNQKVGDEQNVVVSLEGAGEVASAALTLLCAETGEEVSCELTRSAGSSALFSLTPQQGGTYTVVELSLTSSDGTQRIVDFTDCDASYRSFVVDDGIAALSAGEDADEVETNVSASASSGEIHTSDSVESAVSAVATPQEVAPTKRTSSSTNPLDYVVVIALDPGHSENTEAGATGVNGAREEILNWEIANYCKEELETYGNVQVVLTRGQTEGKSLENRVIEAIKHNADALVSIHLNSAGGSAYGAEVYVPYDATYNPETHAVGQKLGEEIIEELEALGLFNRGVKIRVIEDDPDYAYSDGSDGDYYGIIRNARKAGIPGIIVEHAFIDNAGDYNSFLSDASKLKRLGVADAAGIAEAYGLTKVKASDLASVYDEAYYKKKYAGEVSKDPKGAFHHFLTVGMAMGYQASASFSPSYYKNANSDLRAMFGATMAGYYYHFALSGKAEGRPGTGEAEPVATMWRLYNSWTGEHLYTASDSERNICVFQGWTYEGVAWDAPEKSDAPVYRLYNRFVPGGDHHYTMSVKEYDELETKGWKKEGVAWYSAAEEGGVALLRVYNPNALTGTHHYTVDESERDALVKLGWKAEGVGWYGVSSDKTKEE